MKNGQILFDPVTCIKQLRKAGFTQEQAETQAEQMQMMKASLESNLATKSDIEKLQIKLDGIGDKITNRVWAIGFILLGAIFTMGKMGVFHTVHNH